MIPTDDEVEMKLASFSTGVGTRLARCPHRTLLPLPAPMSPTDRSQRRVNHEASACPGVCLRGFRVCIFALNTRRIRIFAWQYKVAMYSSNALQSISMSVWTWAGGRAVGGCEGGDLDEGGCDNDGCAAESDGVSEEAIAAFSTSALCAGGALSMLRCAEAQPEVEVACGPPRKLHAVMEASS